MDKRNALKQAIDKEDINSISQLLKSGIDLNSLGRILMHPISKGNKNEKVFELLFKYGALADNYVIERAYIDNYKAYDERFLENLLQHKMYEKYDHNHPGFSALQTVAETERPNAIAKCELMIKYGIDLHQPRGCMYTPLAIALEYKRNISVIETLLKYGAKPLLEYNSGSEFNIPLQHSFSLPLNIAESVVKYAALQVEHENDEKMHTFFTYFKQPNSRTYLKYAQSCMAEIDILKMITLDAKHTTLFDFVISQENKLKSYLKDTVITNNVFKMLRITALPIYKDVILKKFDRKDIPESLMDCQSKDEDAIPMKSEHQEAPLSLVEGHCKDEGATQKRSECKEVPFKHLEGCCKD